MRLCQELHVPCAPVAEIDEVLEDAQLEARGFWREVEHPEAGRLRYPGPPYQMPDSPGEIGRAPLLGEQSVEIYEDGAGYSSGELARLREEGVI